jgi:NADH:ubiquinone oxidoreductase subunit 2 (subunit N)
MFFKESTADTVLADDITPSFKILLVITSLLIIALGLFPNLLIDWLYF